MRTVNEFSYRTPAVAQYETEENKKIFKHDKNIINEQINGVQNTLAKLNDDIVKHESFLNENQKLFEKLKEMAAQHGVNRGIRLKNNDFKPGNGCNFLKNILFASRYKSEQKNAALLLESAKKNVTLAEGMALANEKICHSKDFLEMQKKVQTEQLRKLKDLKEQLNDLELAETREVEDAATRSANESEKCCTDFALLYQSKTGNLAINAEAHHQFAGAREPVKMRATKVIEEYTSAHGKAIFSISDNNNLEKTFQDYSKGLKSLVEVASKAWYVPKDENIVTWRGQGMTKNGIEALLTQFKKDQQSQTATIYKARNFLSTYDDKKTAQKFADKLRENDVKVIFEVTGNSSQPISVPDALRLNSSERLKLYSPLANFKISDIKSKTADVYFVYLEEVKRDPLSIPFPL